MAEYSRLAKGSFTATGTTQLINLPFTPDYVELWNYSVIKTAAANKVARAWWDNRLVDGSNNPTMIEIYNNASAVVFDTIQTNGISSFSAGISNQSGPSQQVIGITKATQASVNVTAHGYNVGDTVVFNGLYQSPTTGMPQITGIFFTIVSITDANNFVINWNTNQSNYTAISGSPAGSVVSKVLYPFIYAPQINIPATITLGATTTVSTAMYHNFEVGQEIAFRIPAPWGTVQLNPNSNIFIPGSPVYGYVLSITDNWTFVCGINSSSFTAYNTNQTVAAAPGMQLPWVISSGDVNSGGNISGITPSLLYPPPQFPTSTNRVGTINGPAIRGAFVNNTRQGFVIGGGVAAVDVSAAITMIANGNIILWHAYQHDLGAP